MKVLRRLRNWIVWQRVPVGELRIKNPFGEAATASVYAVLFVLAAVLTGHLILWKPLPLLGSASFIYDFWYAIVFKLLFLLTIPLIWYFCQGYTLRDLAPGWKWAPRNVAVLVLAFLAGLSLNLLQGRLDLVIEGTAKFSAGERAVRLAAGVILPFLIAGFPEEFVYRGVLQTRLERVGGRAAAILISVLLFTAWHIPTRYFLAQGVEGSAGDLSSVLLGTGVPVFIVGLVFALLWDRYRSLPPLIAAHWGVDVLPAIISFLGIDY
ncbi:MAG: type II CAAX endopeptidase family protein [Thermoanaerobaculia bacterium]|jgi:membrane protease YdiL (CAAX protease family)